MDLIWKMFFGKLLFSSFADLNLENADPDGQQPDSDEGNGDEGEGDASDSPTDFVEFEGAKISLDAFEKAARERFKDAFDAQENREKWQAENTRKAQEIAEIKRKAELADRLMADPRFQQPAHRPDDFKTRYIQDMQKAFPDVDPRFLEMQANYMEQFAGHHAKSYVDPVLRQQGEQFEREYLTRHPDVLKGSPQYQEIAQLIGNGVDPERAYQIVMFDSIKQKEIESAIKRRDEEAKRKLKASRVTGQQGTRVKSGNFSERANQIIDEMFDQ